MPVKEHVKFLAAWARNPGKVGAIAPSSASLARVMIKDLKLPDGHHVVEFGPGTGPLTRELSSYLPNHTAYLGIERDRSFVRHLKTSYPTMNVVEGSAEDVHSILQSAGIAHVGAVLCGLPFASLPPSVQDRIIDALDRLIQPGALFRTFQYVHAYPLPTAVRFRKRMKSLFGAHERSRAVIRNLPPAYVLTWRR